MISGLSSAGYTPYLIFPAASTSQLASYPPEAETASPVTPKGGASGSQAPLSNSPRETIPRAEAPGKLAMRQAAERGDFAARTGSATTNVGQSAPIQYVESPSARGDITEVVIPAHEFLGITSIGNLGFTASGELVTDSGQPVTGYAATRTANRGYEPNLAGGFNKPIVVPLGSRNVTIGPGGSVNYETPAGVSVTAGYFSLDALSVPQMSSGQGVSLLQDATTTNSEPANGDMADNLALMIDEPTGTGTQPGYSGHATAGETFNSRHKPHVDVTA